MKGLKAVWWETITYDLGWGFGTHSPVSHFTNNNSPRFHYDFFHGQFLAKTNLIRFKINNVKFKKVSTNFSKKVRYYSTAPPSKISNLNSYIIDNPFDNRKSIAEYAKNKKGVHIFEILNKNLYYVGSSINLYSRLTSYFMPSILSKADRRVLR